MYEDFFGLDDEPFRLTADPRYLFLSSKHAEALAHLRLGLTESSGFVCITGEVGSGKTTLLRAFLSEIGPNVTVACIYVPPLSRVELLRSICRELGVSTSSETPSGMLDELFAFLNASHAAGRTCVLVLDEAQALSADLLEQVRLLLNLETATQKLLRIILIGQPQLRRALLDPGLAQLNQRITLRWHLKPLSRGETFSYVAHRLSVASGGRAKRIFTRPALHLLYSVSGGVPRILNMVAHRAMLAAFVAREPRVRRSFVARAYRELQSVPLPGTLSLARKGAWAAAGLAAGLTLFSYGAAPIERLLSRSAAPELVSSPPEAAEPPIPTAAAAAPSWNPELEPGRAQASANRPAAGDVARAVVATGAADLQRRIQNADARADAIVAVEQVLLAWGERLPPGELRAPEDRDAVAWRRGLHELTLTGNASMLRLLDLPALVALRTPGSNAVRYGALTGMDGSRAVLSIGGVPLSIDSAVFASHWSGEARIFWRDYERLGPLLRPGARGIAVVRLQKLLQESGHFDGPATGRFEETTEKAVRSFQRAHRLEVDGRVGPLTQIVLYSVTGERNRPSLASGVGAAS